MEEAFQEPERKAIIKDETRVLTPKEYQKLKEGLSPSYIAICDVLLHTGMRMPEFRLFAKHPEWYDARRHCIDLPTAAIRKKKTVYKTRQISLTIDGCKSVEHFHKMIKDNMVIPSRQAMITMLCRAAVETQIPEGSRGICPKMFRKTIVSWLMKAMPDKMFAIAANMGHTLVVMQVHYTNLSFARDDFEDIRKFLIGWGE